MICRQWKRKLCPASCRKANKLARIRILPDILVNKIAAGEVVERPASVVKELIENALDAGGTRILIEIENGGKDTVVPTEQGRDFAAKLQAVIGADRVTYICLPEAEHRVVHFMGQENMEKVFGFLDRYLK